MIPRLKATNDNRFVSNSFDMPYLLLALFFSMHLFHTPTCSNENVSREFGYNKTYSERIHGLPNIFPPYFLNFIQDSYNLKE